MASYFRTQLEVWLSNLDVNADKVLDIGGGALPVKDRVRVWNVKEYKILDNELEEMKQKPDLIFDLNTSEKVIKEWDNLTGRYVDDCFYQMDCNMVFCLEVFEYIWNPYQALINVNRLMKCGGILYISFPFVYPHHNPAGKDYLRYTRWGVEKLLKETGFEIEEIIPRTQKIEIDYEQDPPQPKQEDIRAWYSSQKMHHVKSGIDHREIGYIVKARKK